jgi:hypothetical protein
MDVETVVRLCLNLAAVSCVGFLAYGAWLCMEARLANMYRIAARAKRGPAGMQQQPDAEMSGDEVVGAKVFCLSTAVATAVVLLLVQMDLSAPVTAVSAAGASETRAGTSSTGSAGSVAGANGPMSPRPAATIGYFPANYENQGSGVDGNVATYEHD